MQRHLLSKSTFISGLQCEKKLFLQKNRRELIPPIAEAQQFIFSQGTKVGELAQELFPGGRDATPKSYYDFRPSVVLTKDWIDKGEKVIYEAAFQFDRVLVAVDILVKEEDGWHAYEVKSSTEVKDVNRNDAAIQYYIMTNSGIDLKDISIVYINNQYALNGELEIHQLFHTESVFQDVQARQSGIAEKVAELKSVLENKQEPNVDIGPHCENPYTCDLKHYCWSHVPSNSVFDIHNLRAKKKWKLYQDGVLNLEDVPEEFDLGDNQRMQLDMHKSGGSVVDANSIKTFLNALKYPLYFLDFETFGTSIPLIDGTRPYQQIVFQYSLHIQHKQDGELIHKEYLADPKAGNFLPDLIQRMVDDCGTEGDIIVYNQGFESGKTRDMISMCPQFTVELNAMLGRIVDLMLPFQKRWYYTPEMRGSYSIKKVLPALVPELSYDDLEVKEGGEASALFSMMMAGLFEGDVDATRNNLLEYCKLDTLAMVEILRFLCSLKL